MIFRDETSQRDIRSSQVEAQKALALYEKAVNEKCGHIIFIAGEVGSGKTDILQVLADTLLKAQPRPLVLAGRFIQGRYVPWDIGKESALSKNAALAALGQGLSLVSPGIGFVAGFAGQFLQTAASVLGLSASQGAQQAQLDSIGAFKKLMRRATEAQPVICLIDDFDEAEAQWNRFLQEMATEIAAEIPLLFFLTVDGPTQLGPHQTGESNLLYTARNLAARGLAEWWPVQPLSRDEIAAWIGRTAAGMVDHLRGATGGNPRWIIELWKEWQYQDVVRYAEPEDEWRWVANHAPSVNPVKDILGDRLKILLESDEQTESDTRRTFDETMFLLSLAALEGARFTADALARALDGDKDELIDFLDDTLAQNDDCPDGILQEDESVTINDPNTGPRTLWCYRFASDLHWQALLRYGLTKAEQSQASLALAHALIEAYSPEEKQIAQTLARLFKTGGDQGKATHYQRMADYGLMREDLRQHTLYMMSLNKDDWNEWDCQQATALFIAAGLKMSGAYPHAETLAVFEAAYEMACRSRLKYDQALALYYCGMLYTESGNYGVAQERSQKALQMFQQIGDRAGEAATWHGLGWVAKETGRLAEGIRLFALSVLILHSIGHADEKPCLSNLEMAASELNYTQEQAEALLQEVGEAYEKDQGRKLLEDAFGEG